MFREKCDYPLHIGVTETGPVKMGLMKSAMGIGALLLDGIGDTIRVSLTDDPVEEVYAAKDILKAAGLRKEALSLLHIACVEYIGNNGINDSIAEEFEPFVAHCLFLLRICRKRAVRERNPVRFERIGHKAKYTVQNTIRLLIF